MFHSVFKEFCIVIDKVKDKLPSLCIICSLGRAKLPLDKYIIATFLPLGKHKICYFHTSVNDISQIMRF